MFVQYSKGLLLDKRV